MREEYQIGGCVFELRQDEDYSILMLVDNEEMERHDFTNSVDSEKCYEYLQSAFRLIVDFV